VFYLNQLLTSSIPQSVQLNSKIITYLPNEENDYFYIGMLIERDRLDDIDICNEIQIRVWKNEKAEAVSLRQVQLNRYEDVYFKKHGFEYANLQAKSEANTFLVRWLSVLKKEYGKLDLYHE